MQQTDDILTLAYKQPIMQDQLLVLQEKGQLIPGSVQYSIRRYSRHPQWNVDDLGMMVYHYKKEDARSNYLELRFCIAGNVYCRQKETECDSLSSLHASHNRTERAETVDVTEL